jgi:integrase
MLQGLRENGKRKRLFFATKAEAEAELARIKAEDNGAILLDASIRMMAREGTEQLRPFGKTLRDAVAFYLAHLRSNPAKSITVAALVTEFLAEQSRLGRSLVHQNDQRQRLSRFLARFSDREVQSITPGEITAWLGLCGGSEPLSAQSVNNYRARVSSLFGYAVKRGYLEKNPVVAVGKVKVEDEPPEIFTPEELRRLLEAATPELLPCLAIGAFTGMRTAELLRLEWKDVHLLDRQYLEVRAKKSKTAQRRLITLSPNLLAWLSPYAEHAGKIWLGTRREYHTACQTARTDAELPKWPNNGLRHSFASYHLAKHQDAPRLALDLGHTSPTLIFSNYREIVTPEAADQYWNILPERAANIVPMVA